MNIKTFLFASATAALMGTSALAVTQDVIDAIVSDLAGQGYTRLEIKNYDGTAKVEAFGPNGTLERVYDSTGGVIREERKTTQGDTVQGDTGGFPGAGSSIDDDEDDDNGAGSDDVDDDDDDNDSHGSGSGDDDDDNDSHGSGSGDDDDDDHGSDDDKEDDDNGGNDDD